MFAISLVESYFNTQHELVSMMNFQYTCCIKLRHLNGENFILYNVVVDCRLLIIDYWLYIMDYYWGNERSFVPVLTWISLLRFFRRHVAFRIFLFWTTLCNTWSVFDTADNFVVIIIFCFFYWCAFLFHEIFLAVISCQCPDLDWHCVWHIDDRIDKSDRKLLRQATQPGHCLHLLPPKTLTYSSYQLRKRQHPYLLPTVQYSQFKNSYFSRCLFKYV